MNDFESVTYFLTKTFKTNFQPLPFSRQKRYVLKSMVEKKLNLNQPILSVRNQRKTSKARHWQPKSGPVKNRGTVPFLWEHSPGRPKEKTLAQQRDSVVPNMTNDNEVSRFSDETNSEAVVEQRQRKKVEKEEPPKIDNEKEGSNEHMITVCCLLPRSFLKTTICTLNPATTVMNRVVTFPATRILSRSSLSCYSTNEYREHGPSTRSFKSLQELLASEGKLKAKSTKTNEEDSDSEEDIIRMAVNKAAQSAKQQLSGGHKLGVAPPPLPESPSDSWLSRTVTTK